MGEMFSENDRSRPTDILINRPEPIFPETMPPAQQEAVSYPLPKIEFKETSLKDAAADGTAGQEHEAPKESVDVKRLKTSPSAPSKEELLRLLDDSFNNRPQEKSLHDDEGIKEHFRKVIESLSSSELRAIGGIVDAMANLDYAKLEKITRQFEKNPARLGELYMPLRLYMEQNGQLESNGYSIAYANGQQQGVLSVKIGDAPYRYFRTDGSDPNTPLK